MAAFFNTGALNPNDLQENGLPFKTALTGNPSASKYDYSNYSYPNDLFGGDGNYGNNYVMFYINVADASYLAKDPTKLIAGTITRNASGAYNNNITTLGAIGAPAAISLIALAGYSASTVVAKVSKIITGGKMLKSAANDVSLLSKGGLTAAAAAVAIETVSAINDGKMARQSKRLVTAIALHVPNNLNIRYSTDWKEEDMMLMEGAAVFAQSLGKLAMSASGSVASAALSAPGGVGNFASVASGLTANPRKEQLFKGVNFREFEMIYEFFPRNSNESANILNIIKQFKLHMHPEFREGNSFIYIYPSEFDIVYYHDDGLQSSENKSVHKHTSCVLVDLQVNYTPNGAFNTFADGTPTQIDIKMAFKELAILTKQDIDEGGY